MPSSICRPPAASAPVRTVRKQSRRGSACAACAWSESESVIAAMTLAAPARANSLRNIAPPLRIGSTPCPRRRPTPCAARFRSHRGYRGVTGRPRLLGGRHPEDPCLEQLGHLAANDVLDFVYCRRACLGDRTGEDQDAVQIGILDRVGNQPSCANVLVERGDGHDGHPDPGNDEAADRFDRVDFGNALEADTESTELLLDDRTQADGQYERCPGEFRERKRVPRPAGAGRG